MTQPALADMAALREKSAALRAEHGPIATHDADTALRLIGLRDQVHPDDVFASVYPTREAADVFAAANLADYGHPTLATVAVDGGWLGVIDLRPCLAACGIAPTDPAAA